MNPMSFPRRTAQPSAEPITLAEALTHLREVSDAGANDAYITSLITAARQACEDRTERSLITTPWLLTLPAFPGASACNPHAAICLRTAPALAVQSVQYLDAAGALQTLDPAAYVLHAHLAPALLTPAPGAVWPAVQAGALNAVRVAFTAGYGASAASVPLPLRQWLLLAIGSMYETRNADSERPQVRSAFVDHLLDPYRLLGV